MNTINTITISKKKYENLVEKSHYYDFFRKALKENIFCPPQEKNVEEVIKAFKKTKKYSIDFIKSLEKGLKRSSYFNRHMDSTLKNRTP